MPKRVASSTQPGSGASEVAGTSAACVVANADQSGVVVWPATATSMTLVRRIRPGGTSG